MSNSSNFFYTQSPDEARKWDDNLIVSGRCNLDLSSHYLNRPSCQKIIFVVVDSFAILHLIAQMKSMDLLLKYLTAFRDVDKLSTVSCFLKL